MSEDRFDRLIGFIGWMTRLKLTDNQATQARQSRERLLAALDGKAAWGFNRSKIYTRELSPGCLTCGQGTWSCLFINGLCTAQCFFCPQDRSRTEERPPIAEEIHFDDPDIYLDYLQRFGFRGVGFSGGETFMVFDKLVSLVDKVRQRFGTEMYIWVYTNGDLIDSAKLRILKMAGLDEIRFNLSARGYVLKPVELARQFIPKVTVEIPTIPEDREHVQRCMLGLNQIGVDYLNLHQLVATKHNYERLMKRNYSFLPPLAFQEPPVLESELAALELIGYSLDHQLKLAINYCSHAYKARYQNLSRRMRAANLAKRDFDQITAAGYLRRLTVCGARDTLQEFVQNVKQNRVSESHWEFNENEEQLTISPALIKWCDLERTKLTLRYFEADLVSKEYLKARKLAVLEQIPFSAEKMIYLGIKPVGELVEFDGRETPQWIERLASEKSWEDTQRLEGLSASTIQAMKKVIPFEQVGSGLQDIVAKF
jgi:pyruvate formate-lyase activating enzyme-like uncharacterized protein